MDSDALTPSPREPERDSNCTCGHSVSRHIPGALRDRCTVGCVCERIVIAAPTVDGRQENIATSDDLNRIAYQTAPLTIAMGDKLSALADALDALAEAVKNSEFRPGAIVQALDKHGRTLLISRTQFEAVRSAITQLLAGRANG